MKNLVLIGMPGCGKTTIAALLARRLNRSWYDSDQQIEAEEGMSVSGLFSQKGEAYFRRRETETIRRLLQKDGAIISVGGGAVLHNQALLRENAFVIYLYRSIDSILTTLDCQTRPLLHDGARRLTVLYEERRALYEQTGRIRVNNEGTPEQTIQMIQEALPCDCLSSTDPT